jgi:hypothetical protein
MVVIFAARLELFLEAGELISNALGGSSVENVYSNLFSFMRNGRAFILHSALDPSLIPRDAEVGFKRG